MPRGEVIDLSLSTDDESPLAQRKVAGFDTARDASLENPYDGFRELADIGAPPKKRRLNHSSGSTDSDFAAVEDFCEIRSLGLPEVAATTAVKSHRLVKPADQWDSNFLVLSPDDGSITSNINGRMTESQSLSSDDSEESFPEDIMCSSTHQPTRATKLSQRTSALLARLDNPTKRKRPLSGESRDRTEKTSRVRARSADLENEELGSQVVQASGKNAPSKRIKSKSTDEGKAAKAERENLRTANRAQKAKEKEEALEMKRIMKEEKAKQKQLDAALAEVNKSKLDKKITGPEMIVDLPASIDGQQIDTQIREFLKNLHIDVSLYQSPMPNMIKWRRKVKSRFNETKGHWEVVEPMVIEEEKYILCLMDAKEFVALASGAPQHNVSDVEAHVAKVKNQFEGCKPIYLIEGLNSWMRKNKAQLNTAYRTAVLNQMDERQDPGSGISQSSSSRRKKDAHKHVDEDVIEDALLQLQVTHRCLVHHTTTTVESAEWVAIFTQQISMIPSRCIRSFIIPCLRLTDY